MISKSKSLELAKVQSQNFDSNVVAHGFMSRNGGVSTGAYASLNTCMKVLEDRRNIVKNLDIIAADFGIEASCLKLVHQVHSNIAVNIDSKETETSEIQADAIVTNTKGILIGVNTADCTPLLFADHKNQVIGAAHAGWRGAFAGVIENTIDLMVKQGAERKNIVAVIGPTIAQKSYEVDDKFKQQFLTKHNDSNIFFIPSVKLAHHMFNLPGFCLNILKKQDIKSATNLDIDTYEYPDTYFSCRRSSHNGEKDFGGQLSAIMLK